MSKKLWAALGVAVLLALSVYTWRNLPQGGRPSPEVLEQQALTAEKPDEREEAAALLTDWGETSKEHMRRVLARSDSPAVRSLMIQGLGNIYDYDSMEVLLNALDDDESIVRARSAVVVRRMLGRQFHYNPDASEPERKKITDLMRREWQGLKGTPLLEDFKQRVKRQSATHTK